MKKKIAIFQKNLSIGGIQRSLINLLNFMDTSKYDIDLYLFSKDKFYDESLPKNINIIYLNPIKGVFKYFTFGLLNKFYKSKINKKYDIAIDYDGYSIDTALALVNSSSKRKVMWVHQDLFERKKHDKKYKTLYFLSRKKFKYVDEFVAVSKGVEESLKKLLNSNVKCTIIPNVILSNEIINKSKEQIDFKVNSNNINLVTMGRICYQKGFDILVDYMNEIVNKKDNIHLYIIGTGPDVGKIKSKIENLELNNNIHLLGGQKNPFNILNKMDLFVLTSRYEGQGMVLMEAKVLGLPLCITDNLEKYNEGIKGSKNFVKDILNFKKKRKKIDTLVKYNEGILYNIYKLLDKE